MIKSAQRSRYCDPFQEQKIVHLLSVWKALQHTVDTGKNYKKIMNDKSKEQPTVFVWKVHQDEKQKSLCSCNLSTHSFYTHTRSPHHWCHQLDDLCLELKGLVHLFDYLASQGDGSNKCIDVQLQQIEGTVLYHIGVAAQHSISLGQVCGCPLIKFSFACEMQPCIIVHNRTTWLPSAWSL